MMMTHFFVAITIITSCIEKAEGTIVEHTDIRVFAKIKENVNY